jgi:Fe2+ transport system protein FeoA
MKPLVQSLADAEVGKDNRIIFINSPGVDRLASIGLVPGAIIRLQQKRPSFVLQIDETTLAIDEELASGIYVRQV